MINKPIYGGMADFAASKQIRDVVRFTELRTNKHMSRL